MQRSASNTRLSDEFILLHKNTKLEPTPPPLDDHQLPTYDPLSHVTKKERSRLRSSENAVHVIPLLLLLCASILWLFSYPESRV